MAKHAEDPESIRPLHVKQHDTTMARHSSQVCDTISQLSLACEQNCHHYNSLKLHRRKQPHTGRARQLTKDYVIVRGWFKRRWRNKVKCVVLAAAFKHEVNGGKRVRVIPQQCRLGDHGTHNNCGHIITFSVTSGVMDVISLR